jgi:hypothetical protein
MAVKVNLGAQRKPLGGGDADHQVIASGAWTVLTYNTLLSANPSGSWVDLATGLFRPQSSHNPAVMGGYAHTIELPPDVRCLRVWLRLVRDPFNEYPLPDPEPNTTTTVAWTGPAAPGQRLLFPTNRWSFKIVPESPIGIEVKYDTERVEQLDVMTSAGVRSQWFPAASQDPCEIRVVDSEFKLTVWA